MTVQSRPCNACRAPVYDLEHVHTRRPAPIDVYPDPAGNILIDLNDGFYTVARKTILVAMTEKERAVLHTNHFATCRYANRFRRQKMEVNDADHTG